MSTTEPARAGGRGPRSAYLVALLVLGTALLAVLCYPSRAASFPSPASLVTGLAAQRPHDRLPGGDDGVPQDAAGKADGVVPDGVTVFDDDYPAVADLDPALLRALRRAATDAADDGLELDVNSGWRSPRYQEQLLQEAIARYGSRQEAARWVATPARSVHVSGDAVDIGPSDAAGWLSRYGAEYGLCQTYVNEPWHFELRRKAVDHGCPTRYADPAHDPRMQQ